MNVKFVKKWEKWRAGEEASFPPQVAMLLIAREFAVEIVAEKPKKEKPKVEKEVKEAPKDKMVKASTSKAKKE